MQFVCQINPLDGGSDIPYLVVEGYESLGGPFVVPNNDNLRAFVGSLGDGLSRALASL
jgi:hypothetical protein